MRPHLQKPFSTHSGRHTIFNKYSNITKLDQERRERGFQVFISGANKERLKIRDLQQESLQAKKAQLINKVTSVRKPPHNTFARRRFWQKSSEIKIKGSDGSKFALQNQKSIKPDIATYGSVLHDITAKTEFHPSAQKNSQLNLIRNRYKAYFHIDGYGFCCSKQTSKPLTPAKYQIDGASQVFNRSSSRRLRPIQNKHVCHWSSPRPCDNEEQKSEYYSILDRNHQHVSKLREFLTPDYEYFQSAQESTISESYNGVANEARCADSCNGIIYDIFYLKEHNISRSVRVLLPVDNQNKNGSATDDGSAKDESNVIFQDEPWLQLSLQVSNVKKSQNENDEGSFLYQDERALVLLENQGLLDGSVNGKIGNKEIEHLPPLGKALSPISRLVKRGYNHEEKQSHIVQEYQFLTNHDDKSSSNCVPNTDLASENVDNGKKNTLKLNLRYLSRGQDFKIPNSPNLDPVQAYVGDGMSTSSNNNGSSRTQECSSTICSTPGNHHTSQAWMSGLEKVDSRLLLEDITSKLPQGDSTTVIVKGNGRRNKDLICPAGVEGISKTGELLRARVKKLDIKKQIYLSYILDRLEIAQVTGSVDLHFYQHSP